MSGPAGPTRRVGIDVGGTKAQGVALDPSGNVEATAQRPTPRGDGSLGALVDTLADPSANSVSRSSEMRRETAMRRSAV